MMGAAARRAKHHGNTFATLQGTPPLRFYLVGVFALVGLRKKYTLNV